MSLETEASDIEIQWGAGEICFDCPCGNKEIIISQSGDERTCDCGRVYVNRHYVAVKAEREIQTRFVKEITIRDYTVEGETEDQSFQLEVHHDPESNSYFAIDATFVDQVTDRIPSPFNAGVILILQDPPEDYRTDEKAKPLTHSYESVVGRFVNISELKGIVREGDNLQLFSPASICMVYYVSETGIGFEGHTIYRWTQSNPPVKLLPRLKTE